MRTRDREWRWVQLAVLAGLCLAALGVARAPLGAQIPARADSAKAAFGALKGVVVAPDGKPVAGVDVVVLTTALRVRSRGDGSFLVSGIPPGDYEVLFR